MQASEQIIASSIEILDRRRLILHYQALAIFIALTFFKTFSQEE